MEVLLIRPLTERTMNEASPPPRQPAIILKLGNANVSLTGPWALFALALVLALLTALVSYAFMSGRITPRSLVSPLILSAWLWLLFLFYWSAAALDPVGGSVGRSFGRDDRHDHRSPIVPPSKSR